MRVCWTTLFLNGGTRPRSMTIKNDSHGCTFHEYGALLLQAFGPRGKRTPIQGHPVHSNIIYLHFQVAISETGKQILLGIGVVNERYNTSKMPGWKNGSVGFHTDGTIFDAANSKYGRETRGTALATGWRLSTVFPRISVHALISAHPLGQNRK